MVEMGGHVNLEKGQMKNEGWKEVFDACIVERGKRRNKGNGGVPCDSERESARKRADIEG